MLASRHSTASVLTANVSNAFRRCWNVCDIATLGGRAGRTDDEGGIADERPTKLVRVGASPSPREK
jgi:hypothetical protein